MHPRTRPTLENWARMTVHPTGVRDFAQAVAEDLDLTKSAVGKLLRYSGTLFDGGKYLLYGMCAGSLIYHNLIKPLINHSQ